MDNRTEAREFLVSRRSRITPEQAGLEPIGGRRRVPGLRREEVGGALGPAPGCGVRCMQYLLDAITGAPAFIANNRMDIVAANDLGYAMYSDMYRGTARPANHSRFIFLDPLSHNFYPDWDRAANVNVAILRREAGRNPHDKRIAELVGELSMRSDEFRTRWAAHNVRRHYSGTKTFRHPVVGLLELTYAAMELEDDPGHTLTVYPAVPGSPSDEALRLLASWAATERIAETARAASRA
ncbi:transcriptional regulator [Arthrobacter sp. ISL-65]|uniref:MmyB family transcriptional regulator n=1 Tax=Arthrobacter sp. ISL-65 TaxID=2819112 RepID=UPI001BEC57E1|nr:transcriptional regulator [Arthrobacter sp. ISL-65]MBT2547705.1 transcriptional regulator [Arthrobacter sp. ISL-65]